MDDSTGSMNQAFALSILSLLKKARLGIAAAAHFRHLSFTSDQSNVDLNPDSNPHLNDSDRNGYGDKSINDDKDEFDASAAPPFTIGEIRAAIPKHCWEKSLSRSFLYVLKDFVTIFVLGLIAYKLNSWAIWPLYWFAQGTMFWALFVLGHDCGHGSFSSSKTLNNIIGHITHTVILVPFHGWRISHRTHHQNHGHVENDESWYPLTETTYKNLDWPTIYGRFTLPFALLAYPIYLWNRSPGKEGSHFDPGSPLFAPNERADVTTSTMSYGAMLALLAALSAVFGPWWMIKLYFMPYLIYVIWLDSVTYLHHHGYDKKIPWYRGKEWSYLRGGLSTIDRDYGIFNNIHHDIGTHVVHHLFPQIPHYHLVEATAAIRPILGKYYREPKKSGALPLHLVEILTKSFKEDHYVSDEGDIVFYKKDDHK